MMSTTKVEAMTKIDDRLDRLERALAQLAAGVDWSVQRGGRDARALREICAEQDVAGAARPREQRPGTSTEFREAA